MPIELMREALRQLASQAYLTVQDPEMPWYKKLGAFLIIVLGASPMAGACLIAVFLLAYQGRQNHRMCVDSAEDARIERREHAANAAKTWAAIEKQIVNREEKAALREERNRIELQASLKEVERAVDRVTAAVSGKTFIQKSPSTKPGSAKKGDSP